MAAHFGMHIPKWSMARMNKPYSLAEAGISLVSSKQAKGANEQRAPAPSSLCARDLPMLRPPFFDRTASFTSRRVITPRECRPYRPRPKPRWSPTRRRNAAPRPLPFGFRATKVTFEAAPDLGEARINFSYNNHFSTSTDFCEKAGRQQYCEGPHEASWRRWATVNPSCTDFQFQPLKVTFEDDAGNRSVCYWDIGFELADGSIAFGEIKADETFFLEGETRLFADAAADALSAHQIAFLRLHGTDFDEITSETIKRVFDQRRTSFDPASEASGIIAAIAASGGAIKMAEALKIIGGWQPEAEAKLCAMMVKKHIALGLEYPLTGDTIITLPPKPRDAGALRRFLASCSPNPTGE